MSKLDNIHSKYPNLFKETTKIRCGEGWYWLIDNLCYQINQYVEHKNNPNKYINQQLGSKFEEFESGNKFYVNINYIREKFGVLEVYCNDTDDEIYHYIKFACNLSTKICEKCGSTKYMGKTEQWVKYLCMDCGKKDKNKWIPTKETEKQIRKDKLLKIHDNDNS